MAQFAISPQLRFHCSQCGKCCRYLQIPLSNKDLQKIHKTDWQTIDSNLAGKKITAGSRGQQQFLATAACNGCVFLTAKQQCLIHAHLGKNAKPIACRIFPFKFTPIANKIYVGLKYNCPGVISGKGPAVKNSEKELRQLFKEYTRNVQELKNLPLAPFYLDFCIPWESFADIEEVMTTAMETTNISILKRLILGTRIVETLKREALGGGNSQVIALDPHQLYLQITNETLAIPKIHFGERMLFAQFLGYIACKFLGSKPRFMQIAERLKSGWNKAGILLGKGKLYLESGIGIAVSKVKTMPAASLSGAAHDLLQRYYTSKLFSRDYFGSAFFNLPFVAGFNLLVVSYPLVLWVARAHALSCNRHNLELEDYQQALYIVDFCLYSSDILAGAKGKIMSFMLASPQLAERVACYYSIAAQK